MRTFDDFAAAAIEWHEDSVRLLHEMEGCYLYEALSMNGRPAGDLPKERRYGIAAWVEDDSRWFAWDCNDRVFSGHGWAGKNFPPHVLETFRQLTELLP